tara:strand:- start:1512 stop:1844 length:333 start_codon:yes stop_codon:yes gene_type:complete
MWRCSGLFCREFGQAQKVDVSDMSGRIPSSKGNVGQAPALQYMERFFGFPVVLDHTGANLDVRPELAVGGALRNIGLSSRLSERAPDEEDEPGIEDQFAAMIDTLIAEAE